MNDRIIEEVTMPAIDRFQQEQQNTEKESAATVYNNTKKLIMNYKNFSEVKGDKLPITLIIEQALIAYKESCINSKKENLIRRYNMMYYYFIETEKKELKDLAEKYYVNERTVSRDITNAIYDMMIHFYGIDGLIALIILKGERKLYEPLIELWKIMKVKEGIK